MIAALACISVVLTIPRPVLNFDKLIAAIEAVESPNERDPWAKAGGAANFKPVLWYQYCAIPYYYSSNPHWSRETMRHAFADWIERYIALDITPTPYRLAAAWNLGFSGALHAVRTETCFGSRVANLYEAGNSDRLVRQLRRTMDPLLTPEDSKRVADAMIEASKDASRRFDAMCANMEANHWQAEQQRVAHFAPVFQRF